MGVVSLSNLDVKTICGKDFLVIKTTEIREYIDNCPIDSWSELSKYYTLKMMNDSYKYLESIPEGIKKEGIHIWNLFS